MLAAFRPCYGWLGYGLQLERSDNPPSEVRRVSFQSIVAAKKRGGAFFASPTAFGKSRRWLGRTSRKRGVLPIGLLSCRRYAIRQAARWPPIGLCNRQLAIGNWQGVANREKLKSLPVSLGILVFGRSKAGAHGDQHGATGNASCVGTAAALDRFTLFRREVATLRLRVQTLPSGNP
jgi:hypothetical protein